VTNVRWILDEMAALSRQLLEVGKGGARGARTSVRLDRLVADHLRLASGHPAVRGCRVTSLVDEGLEAEVDRNRFGALLLNLVLNAAEATSGTGRVHVGLKARGDEVVLEVHDDGPGVPESERDRIFDAFRTTKPQGTGLGLLTVRSVTDDHGGSVEVERSDELGGACFRVTIPKKIPG
jgi:signal transduction histidine kinase